MVLIDKWSLFGGYIVAFNQGRVTEFIGRRTLGLTVTLESLKFKVFSFSLGFGYH